MITQRLTNCTECTSITNLLADIECKLTEMANDLYNNTVFALNRPVCEDVWLDLLNYKRILTYKFCNPQYASHYSVEQIASRVKLLIFK